MFQAERTVHAKARRQETARHAGGTKRSARGASTEEGQSPRDPEGWREECGLHCRARGVTEGSELSRRHLATESFGCCGEYGSEGQAGPRNLEKGPGRRLRLLQARGETHKMIKGHSDSN